MSGDRREVLIAPSKIELIGHTGGSVVLRIESGVLEGQHMTFSFLLPEDAAFRLEKGLELMRLEPEAESIC